MTTTSTFMQKITASVVNCSLVIGVSWPFRRLLTPTGWKLLAVLLFWTYSLVMAGNDVGMWVAGTQCEPTGVVAATAYTASFCSLLFRIRYAGDLTIINGCLQIPCLYECHNTLHGLVAGYHTVARPT